MSIGVKCLNCDIIDFLSYGKSRIRGEGPWSCRPGQEEYILFPPIKQEWRFFIFNNLELGHDSRIFHITVTARKVQFMRAKASSRSRWIWLNRVAFIQQPFLIQLSQQVPYGFNIFIGKGHIWMIKVNPITHFLSQVIPLVLELHDLNTAGFVIIFYRDLFANIFLGDTQCFLNLYLNR